MGVREEKGGGVEEEWGREFGGEAEWGLGGPDDGGKRRIVLSKPLNSKGQLRRERGGQARPELGLKNWTRGTDSGGKGLGGGGGLAPAELQQQQIQRQRGAYTSEGSPSCCRL